MISTIRDHVLPESQKRTLEELRADLDLTEGDARAKQSAFWTMLVLSSVIAACGVLTDSTATVIGAMIIAPMSTPIMGMALGAIRRRRTGGIVFVVLGALLVILIGALFSLLLPRSYHLLSNSQIAGRTSPGLLDLLAALATGFAGAVALARRDVAAILPGVAIAISLVPPLVVCGVCGGQGSWWLALGALVLFVSNLLALVLAGVMVFTTLGYAAREPAGTGRVRRRTYVVIGLLFAVVLVPLAADTTLTVLLKLWTTRVSDTANVWLAHTPGATVTDVQAQSRTFVVRVSAPGDVPSVKDLLTDLEGKIPDGIPIVVATTRGQRIEAGKVGG